MTVKAALQLVYSVTIHNFHLYRTGLFMDSLTALIGFFAMGQLTAQTGDQIGFAGDLVVVISYFAVGNYTLNLAAMFTIGLGLACINSSITFIKVDRTFYIFD